MEISRFDRLYNCFQEDCMTTKGVLYVVYGENAVNQAEISIVTLRRHARSIPIAVVSNVQVKGATIQIDRPEADKGARTWKTQMYSLSPFDKTLFLDADTEVLSSLDPGFGLLNYVDMVIVQDYNRVFADNKWPHLNKEEVAVTVSELGTNQFMYFNSGVIFFQKNDRINQMMTAWHKEWLRWKMHDQMALLRAIHNNPIRIAPIRAPWNTHHRNEAIFVYHKHRQARREGAPR